LIGLVITSIPGLIGIISDFTYSPADRGLAMAFGLLFLGVGAPIGAVLGFLIGKSAERSAKKDNAAI